MAINYPWRFQFWVKGNHVRSFAKDE